MNLIVTNLAGESLPLLDYRPPMRTRNIDGTHTLSVVIREIIKNKRAVDLIEGEGKLSLNNNTYRIKKLNRDVKGNVPQLEITALHTFFDIIHDYQYDIIEGEKVLSLHQGLSHALEKTDITFIIEDEFDSLSFENFGDANSLNLFEKLRTSFGFEFIIENDTFLRIRKQIGSTDKPVQMRWKHNIVTIKEEIDTTNLATYVKGYGKPKEDADGNIVKDEYVVATEYTSPKAHLYDKLYHADPVYDERFIHEPALREHLKKRIVDEPEVSYTIEYNELKKTGVESLELGDSAFLIHEVLGLDFNTRAVEVIDFPTHPNIKPIYTISSKKESMTDKQVQAAADKQSLRDSVRWTKSRQTELDRRMEKVVEAVADVENAMKYVDEEMERIENEVIPEIEKALEDVYIPKQTDPPDHEKHDLWWDTSINPPRLKRWDGSQWIVLAPNEEEVGGLLEDMRNDINYNIIPSINESPTGFQIEAPKLDINGLVEFTNRNTNLIPMHPSNWENGYIGAATGNENDRDYALRMIDFLTVEPNTVYTINAIAGANIFIREYEEDRFVNNHPTQLRVGNSRTFTTDENSRFIRFYWSNPDVDKIYPEEVGTVYRATFVKGDEALSWESSKATIINGGRLVNNHITTNQLDVNNIFGNSAVIQKIQSDIVLTTELNASKIVTGELNAADVSIVNLSASSIISGDLDASKIRVRNLNASEINSGELNAINIYGSTITGSDFIGGRLSALNNNTDFNLNTGSLTIGRGANIEFTDSGNKLYYNRNLGAYNHTAGVGFGTSINDRYPFAYLGTVEGGSLSATDERDFSGFITNTLARTKVDEIGNSVVGQVFHIRDKAIDFNKGIKFNFQSESSGVAYVYPINTGSCSYSLGRVGNKWWEGHFDKIFADVSLGVSGTMYANGQATFNGRLVAHSARQNSVTYTANLNIGVTGGLISRVSSSQKYKLVTEDITLNPYDLLKVNPRMWFDKNNTEQYADLLTRQEKGETVDCKGEKIRRIPGLVAEEVEAAGLGLFVGYDENDKVESVLYDRAWIMLIPIVRELVQRIEKLEHKLEGGI